MTINTDTREEKIKKLDRMNGMAEGGEIPASAGMTRWERYRWWSGVGRG
jgi:hypothetical protein